MVFSLNCLLSRCLQRKCFCGTVCVCWRRLFHSVWQMTWLLDRAITCSYPTRAAFWPAGAVIWSGSTGWLGREPRWWQGQLQSSVSPGWAGSCYTSVGASLGGSVRGEERDMAGFINDRATRLIFKYLKAFLVCYDCFWSVIHDCGVSHQISGS